MSRLRHPRLAPEQPIRPETGRGDRRSSRSGARRRGTGVAWLGIAALLSSALLGAGSTSASASVSPSVPRTSGAPKAGRTGATITLEQHASFDGDQRAYDLATDHAGTSFIAWIATDDTGSQGRQVFLCTLPEGATACAGGTQVIDPPDAQSVSGLRLLVSPGGSVTVVWVTNVKTTTRIFDAAAAPGGRLGAVAEDGAIPANGRLLDAEIGPDNEIWTVAVGSGPLQVRDGLTGAPVAVKTPYDVGFASLAFSGASIPIIAITEAGRITQPVAYTSRPAGDWTSFHNVAGTWAEGTDVGLTTTASGVRLIAVVDNASYYTVVARWTGSGFAKPTPIGGGLTSSAHDTFTDPSGRLVEVGERDDDAVTVSNLADTLHAATFTFPDGSANTFAGGAAQATTTPRGHGWVAWSYQSSATSPGDRLEIAPFVLAGLHASRTTAGHRGSVTVTGPASCLPAVGISVGVDGSPDKGYRATTPELLLDGDKVGSTLDGASLVANRTYTLTGSVVFVDGTSHDTVKAAVTFRACPNP